MREQEEAQQFPRQVNKEGMLGEYQSSAIAVAQRVYLERKNQDTNPQIVEMLINGKSIGLCYYRSDQWIVQLHQFKNLLIQPHQGPPHEAYWGHYGEGTYVVVKGLMDLAEKGITVPDKSVW